MEKYLNIEEDLLKHIFHTEAQKIVGKCLKRFELTDDKELIKKEIKELLYEAMRDVRDTLVNCSKSKNAINLTKL